MPCRRLTHRHRKCLRRRQYWHWMSWLNVLCLSEVGGETEKGRMGRGAAKRAAYISLFRLVRMWEFSKGEVNTEWWLVLSHLARLSLRVWLLVMKAKEWVEEVESELGQIYIREAVQ